MHHAKNCSVIFANICQNHFMGLLDTPKSIQKWSENCKLSAVGGKKIPQRKRILMVHPQHFQIAYAINPHMKTVDGNLKQINSKKALEQWKNIVQTFEECGLDVEILDAHAQYPDMVFAANQCFPFWNLSSNAAEVMISNMTYKERKGEVPFFENYFKTQEYKTYSLPTELNFEGTGDALLENERKVIFCGYGFRTHQSIPSRICEVSGYDVVPLELKNADYYHLDTALALLNGRDVVAVKEAFSDEGWELITAAFQNVIEADPLEAKHHLSANLFCPNSKDVVIDEGNTKLIQKLEELNYRVHPVDTSEFLKAGGSVFCLKLFYW